MLRQSKKFSTIAIIFVLIISGCGGGGGGGGNTNSEQSSIGEDAANSGENSPSGGMISLAWDASTDHDVIGYKVYHGLASRTYGSPIDAGDVTAVIMDHLIIGQTYFVAVTAYDSSGNESPFSNEVSGTAK